MQPMKNRVMEWRELPVFFWGLGQGRRFFLLKLCLVWRVDCSLSTWTVDNQLSMRALGGLSMQAWRGVKSNSSQVPDMFLEEFTIGPHFYVWQMLGQRGRALYFKIEPSILGSLRRFFFQKVMAQSNWLIAPPKKKHTWEVPYLINRGGERERRMWHSFPFQLGLFTLELESLWPLKEKIHDGRKICIEE
jgi:hypothetical protein